MFYGISKRLIDIFASLILIIIFLPIWLIVPILIKLESDGPIFYFQKRIGKNGRPFKIIKFRTMRADADEYWQKNPKLFEKYKKLSWKLTLEEDPRITRLGKILRQTSIDEFPQVFNILIGSMSLVGPRPIRDIEIEDAVDRYGKPIRELIDASLTAKPGLTGLWQVSGRNDVSWNKRVELDASYAKRKNIIEDFAIMIKTPFAMISKW